MIQGFSPIKPSISGVLAWAKPVGVCNDSTN
jgi:hypothetical protein